MTISPTNPTLLSAIESIAAEMARLTTGLPTRFEIRHRVETAYSEASSHLRLVTPDNPEGHRQGRNFAAYQRMAEDTSTSLALIDFAGIILRFMELFPAKFDELRPQVIALAPLMNFADESDRWVKVWQ